MIQLKNIQKSYSGHAVIKDASFIISKGDKIAIVGRNGVGKSTLINIIMKLLPSDKGEVIFFDKNTTIGWMPQTISELNMPDDINVYDFLLTARPIQELSTKISELYTKLSEDTGDHTVILEQISEYEDEFERHGGYQAESELNKLIAGFNLDEDLLYLDIKDLSGGQKSKIAFVRALYSNDDLLILDEPTNHLDQETRDWVMDYLRVTKKTIISISHDEEFLNTVVNRIIYMNLTTRCTESYPGNYAKFNEIIADKSLHLTRQYENNKKAIDKMQAFVDQRHGMSGKRKRQAQNKEKMLDRFKKNQVAAPIKESNIKLTLKPNRFIRGVPLSLSKVGFAYEKGNPIIHNANLTILTNERFIVTGHNGAGKSTLLKLIADKLKADCGAITKDPKLDIGYYDQEHGDLNQENDLITELREDKSEKTESQLRAALGSFNFKDKKVFQKISTLSPGERSRFALLKLCLSGANLLLLDEPTNHLDLHTKKVVGNFLKEYGGTVILVSHDADLLDAMNIERMLVLPSCKIEPYSLEFIKHIESTNK
ncbi:MAG: ABC-F family ATP-binding cassette domain-containing protein [Proteobacteria bacterium]|nr:ABC-F family ATP-binding cassette domain-containing protein [Pseudomonadota bacterium]